MRKKKQILAVPFLVLLLFKCSDGEEHGEWMAGCVHWGIDIMDEAQDEVIEVFEYLETTDYECYLEGDTDYQYLICNVSDYEIEETCEANAAPLQSDLDDLGFDVEVRCVCTGEG